MKLINFKLDFSKQHSYGYFVNDFVNVYKRYEIPMSFYESFVFSGLVLKRSVFFSNFYTHLITLKLICSIFGILFL